MGDLTASGADTGKQRVVTYDSPAVQCRVQSVGDLLMAVAQQKLYAALLHQRFALLHDVGNQLHRPWTFREARLQRRAASPARS